MSIQISAEVTAESLNGNGYYYGHIDLPASDYEIKDLLEKLRMTQPRNALVDISISECPLIPELEDSRMDSTTIEELNFLARRLDGLDEDDETVYEAVIAKVVNFDDEIISIKDLINCTYGLENVSVISNVDDLVQLGQFVIENNLSDVVNGVPDNAMHLLDKAAVGRELYTSDSGQFANGKYIITGEYKMPEVYDGRTLPFSEDETAWAFKLLIARTPRDESEDPGDNAVWIELPMDYAEANKIAQKLGEKNINDCVYLDFKSVIPQITDEQFGSMVDFQKLNALANHITVLSPTESVKFKAVLEAESPQTIDGNRETADSLWQYEMTSAPHDPDTFYKQYMRQHLDSRIDAKWIDTLILQNEGATLIDRLGGALTDYGVISARGVSLYAPVPYDAPSENKEIKSQALTDEKLDVIEVLDRKALFSNGRVMPEELPAGLYAYDLRMNDDQDRFVSIEKSVMVNHGGTLLFKEALDLGVSGRIALTFDTEPNFLGEELTPNEFLNEDIEESETQTQGGMSL